METNTIERAADSALQFAHLTHEVSKARTLLGDVIEDGKRKAQRTLKRTYLAAEDQLDETTYYIKRHPWQSVGIAAGVGVGAGLFAGWMFLHACPRNGQTEFQAVER